MTTQTQPKPLVRRHPVVVVLGHIDHGKTTLLDTIRKTNVVAREAGGITQHLGAYEIMWGDKKITFLDTPGHETFSKMRERGARVADVAILVVAADDGVKPQTKEAHEAIKKAEIPFLVALNKIDKPSADLNRAKASLADIGILVEGWGGSVPIVPISAKNGTNIEELLETLLLLTDLEDLSGNPEAVAEGVVIESHLDPRRGPAATLLILEGTLHKGEFVLAGNAWAPVRILESTDGEPVSEASLSTPVRVVGFNEVPAVGSHFFTYSNKKELTEHVREISSRAPSQAQSAEIGILVKTDTMGSYEALVEELGKIVPTELSIKFFEGGVGEVTETDVKTISAAKQAFVIGFNVKAREPARDLAERFGVRVQIFNIIYEAIDWAKETFQALVPKKVIRQDLGKLIVLKIFRSGAAGRIIGGRVRDGEIRKGALFDIIREDTRAGSGAVIELERNKIKVEVLRAGEEGGLLVQSPKVIEERDTLVFYYEKQA